MNVALISAISYLSYNKVHTEIFKESNMSKSTIKPLAALLGGAFVTAMAQVPATQAAENPFATTELETGYKVASKAEGKCGEGKCGGEKKAAGEGKCGGDKKAAGEGKCGGDKKAAGEGKCGGEKKAAGEGKCGEGKCGGKS